MGSSYYRWSPDKDVSLQLTLVDSLGAGKTGESPKVEIRRHRQTHGGALDDFFWDGAAFQATPQTLAMTELDAANSPGVYVYLFEQTLIQNETVYLVQFTNTGTPKGVVLEQHIFSKEVFLPTATVAIIASPTTIRGQLEEMKDSTKDVAVSNANAVWDQQTSENNDAGSFGEALQNCASGATGSNAVVITVNDTSPAPIQGVQVDIYDATNTAFITRLTTDTNGQVKPFLDDNTYAVRLFKSGYAFTVPETLVVSGATAETYTGTSFISISPPTAPDLCVIFGTIRDATGAPIAGACVQANAVTPQVVAGVQKGERLATTTTDVNGFFQIELVRTTTVNIVIEDADIDVERVVPDTASQDFALWT